MFREPHPRERERERERGRERERERDRDREREIAGTDFENRSGKRTSFQISGSTSPHERTGRDAVMYCATERCKDTEVRGLQDGGQTSYVVRDR